MPAKKARASKDETGRTKVRRRQGGRTLPSREEEERMEAKVDVRKLQVLNDRINQTIDALNQVRLSVHGLGHTSNPQLGFMSQGFGFPQTQGLGQQFPQTQGWGQQGFTGGLGHTGGVGVPPQLNPLTYLTQGQGFGPQGYGQIGQQGGYPGIGGGFQGQGGFGLQHSGINPYLNPIVNPQVLQQLGM